MRSVLAARGWRWHQNATSLITWISSAATQARPRSASLIPANRLVAEANMTSAPALRSVRAAHPRRRSSSTGWRTGFRPGRQRARARGIRRHRGEPCRAGGSSCVIAALCRPRPICPAREQAQPDVSERSSTFKKAGPSREIRTGRVQKAGEPKEIGPTVIGSFQAAIWSHIGRWSLRLAPPPES